MKFNTYYETGSIQRGTNKPHRTYHNSKAAATKRACAISKRTGSYVSVMKGGINVAMCLRGKRVKP